MYSQPVPPRPPASPTCRPATRFTLSHRSSGFATSESLRWCTVTLAPSLSGGAATREPVTMISLGDLAFCDAGGVTGGVAALAANSIQNKGILGIEPLERGNRFRQANLSVSVVRLTRVPCRSLYPAPPRS